MIAGESQPPAVHALAHAMNEALGAVGTTVTYTAPAEAAPVGETAALAALVGEMQAGTVEVLVDPRRRTRPTPPPPTSSSPRRSTRCRSGSTTGSTSTRRRSAATGTCRPRTRSRAGATCAPRTAPSRSSSPSSRRSTARSPRSRSWPRSARASRRATTSSAPTGRRELGAADFEKRWNRALHDGVVAGTAFEPKAVKVVARRVGEGRRRRRAAGGLEIAFRTDPAVFDGRFANLGWLQELPKPLSKITWDNVALVSPKTAARARRRRRPSRPRAATTPRSRSCGSAAAR